MNNLIIYTDERKSIDGELKLRTIIETDKDKHELFLSEKSLQKLKESNKFNIIVKTFSDKIMDEFNKVKSVCEE